MFKGMLGMGRFFSYVLILSLFSFSSWAYFYLLPSYAITVKAGGSLTIYKGLEIVWRAWPVVVPWVLLTLTLTTHLLYWLVRLAKENDYLERIEVLEKQNNHLNEDIFLIAEQTKIDMKRNYKEKEKKFEVLKDHYAKMEKGFLIERERLDSVRSDLIDKTRISKESISDAESAINRLSQRAKKEIVSLARNLSGALTCYYKLKAKYEGVNKDQPEPETALTLKDKHLLIFEKIEKEAKEEILLAKNKIEEIDK